MEAYPSQAFAGQITRIARRRGADAGLALEGRVGNADNRLRPGFFAKGVVLTQGRRRGVRAAEAVVYVGISKVFVVTNGKVEERLVKAGSRQGALVEIVDGSEAG